MQTGTARLQVSTWTSIWWHPTCAESWGNQKSEVGPKASGALEQQRSSGHPVIFSNPRPQVWETHGRWSRPRVESHTQDSALAWGFVKSSNDFFTKSNGKSLEGITMLSRFQDARQASRKSVSTCKRNPKQQNLREKQCHVCLVHQGVQQLYKLNEVVLFSSWIFLGSYCWCGSRPSVRLACSSKSSTWSLGLATANGCRRPSAISKTKWKTTYAMQYI